MAVGFGAVERSPSQAIVHDAESKNDQATTQYPMSFDNLLKRGTSLSGEVAASHLPGMDGRRRRIRSLRYASLSNGTTVRIVKRRDSRGNTVDLLATPTAYGPISVCHLLESIDDIEKTPQEVVTKDFLACRRLHPFRPRPRFFLFLLPIVYQIAGRLHAAAAQSDAVP